MKKLLTGILFIGILCLTTNINLACDCGCGKEEKVPVTNECVKKDCDCGCRENKDCTCPKEEIKKCDKPYAKPCDIPCKQKCKELCDKPCNNPCKEKCNRPCSKQEQAKSVSDIIDDTVTEGKDCKCKELNICSKTYKRCKFRKYKKNPCKKVKSNCKKQECPIKKEVETSEE